LPGFIYLKVGVPSIDPMLVLVSIPLPGFIYLKAALVKYKKLKLVCFNFVAGFHLFERFQLFIPGIP
jgi:hypothetical protein